MTTLYQAKFFSIGMDNKDLNYTAMFTDRKKAVEWSLRKANIEMPYYMLSYPDIDLFVGIREWNDCDGKFRPCGRMHFLIQHTHDEDGFIEPFNPARVDLPYFAL